MSSSNAAAAGASAGRVFVKRAGDPNARFAAVPILAGDYVADLAKRASLEWGVDAAYLDLFLVSEERKATVAVGDAGSEALVLATRPLCSIDALSAAGVLDRSCLLARLLVPHAAAPGENAAAGVGSAGGAIALLGAGSGGGTGNLVREIAAMLEPRLLQAIAGLAPPSDDSPLSPSFAAVGGEALTTLRGIPGAISELVEPPESAPEDERAPFASAAELARLRDCASEAELVAAITPLLRAARGFDEEGADPCARLLVNSEAVRWLDALRVPLPHGQLKEPDMFVTWAPFWEGRVEAARGGPVGKLASRALQLDGCVREFYEAKIGEGELTPADFGQLLDYHSRVRGPVRGVLFNAASFWLCASIRDKPQQLLKGRWAARGSRAALRRFLDGNAPPEPPLVPLLRFLLCSLRAELCPVAANSDADAVSGGGGGVVGGGGGVDGGRAEAGAGGGGEGGPGGQRNPTRRCFLGAGASARVFAVRRDGVGLCALKASAVEPQSAIEYEFGRMSAAAAGDSSSPRC